MNETKLVAVRCQLSKGMFSSERVFTITLANGETYQGLSPRHFCWNSQGALIGEDEAVTRTIEGKVAAKLLDVREGESIVEVPDGRVLAVMEAAVGERPTPIIPPRASASA